MSTIIKGTGFYMDYETDKLLFEEIKILVPSNNKLRTFKILVYHHFEKQFGKRLKAFYGSITKNNESCEVHHFVFGGINSLSVKNRELYELKRNHYLNCLGD